MSGSFYRLSETIDNPLILYIGLLCVGLDVTYNEEDQKIYLPDTDYSIRMDLVFGILIDIYIIHSTHGVIKHLEFPHTTPSSEILSELVDFLMNM